LHKDSLGTTKGHVVPASFLEMSMAHCEDFKAMRCAQRNKSLIKKRADYAQMIEQKEQRGIRGTWSAPFDSKRRARSVPVAHRRSHPQGAVRTVARTWMAKGQVESDIDVPSISRGRVGQRKPSVSHLLSFSGAHGISAHCADQGLVSPTLELEKVSCQVDAQRQNFDVDVDTTASESMDFDCISPASTFAKDAPLVEDLANDILELEPPAHCDVTMDGTHQEALIGAVDDGIQTLSLFDENCTTENPQIVHGAGAFFEQPSLQPGGTKEATTREQVMRQVIGKLREQALVAEQKAAAAKARAQELAKQVASQKRVEKGLSKKEILRVESQRSAQLRKQRNQAAHVQALKGKAESALQEAEKIRNKAEAEAAETHARLLAEASKSAQEQVDAQVQAVLAAAKAEADAVKFDSEEAAKQTQELKAEAEVQLAQMKAHAEKEHQATQAAKVEAEALRAEAELAARAIREAAFQDAMAFKARVEVQMQEKRDANTKAQQEMEAKLSEQAEHAKEAAAAAEAQHLAEAKARKESVATLKLGKAMEQQRSKKLHKQAQQERQQEELRQRELDAVRIRMQEESRAAQEQAMAEIASMKKKMKADAKKECQRTIAAAQAMAQTRNEEIAAALLDVAKTEADNIKAAAAKQAQERKMQEELQQEKACLESKTLRAQTATHEKEHAMSEDADEWHVVFDAVVEAFDEENNFLGSLV